jgi:uncharacterized protein YciI
LLLVPHREKHLEALNSLKQTADAKIISAPFFPDSEGIIFIQSEAEDPKSSVDNFVKNDPYMANNLIKDYQVREFAITDFSKDFDRFSGNLLMRS